MRRDSVSSSSSLCFSLSHTHTHTQYTPLSPTPFSLSPPHTQNKIHTQKHSHKHPPTPQALADAGLTWDGPEINDLDKMRAGILIGSAMGGMTSWAGGVESLTLSGFRKMNPFCVPFSITNMGGAMLAMDVGFMGPNYSISTACATGNYCIINAAQHIQRGEADLMLAGGTDAAIIPSGMGGFSACKALSTRNEDPRGASRPWDTQRDGFVMGEGSGMSFLVVVGVLCVGLLWWWVWWVWWVLLFVVLCLHMYCFCTCIVSTI